MKILVTGANGRVGSQVVEQLVKRGAQVRALVRDIDKKTFPESVEVAQGDFLDPDSLRRALEGITTLFLLNAVTGDEVTQALNALNLANEAGIKRIVYLSVIHSDVYVNVPHFAGKYAVERMIEHMDISATILRPAYFMDNDLTVKDIITNFGIYPMPIGDKGLAMIDIGDIAEIAAIELIRRTNGSEALPMERITLVGPEALDGNAVAKIWSEVLDRPIVFGGSDPEAFEGNLRNIMPAWMAYDMRLMSERFIKNGMIPIAGEAERLPAILGRPLRPYRDFALSTAALA